MDSFEQVVSEILWMEGHWVRTSVKVDLTKDEKIQIGRPSSPRWELDIVAYGGRDNVLQVVECKSYIDSYGVRASGFDGSKATTKIATSSLTMRTCAGSSSTACASNSQSAARVGQTRMFDSPWLAERSGTATATGCASTSKPRVGNCGTSRGYASDSNSCPNADTRTKFPLWWQNCCSEER
jgi:hypothetical protein